MDFFLLKAIRPVRSSAFFFGLIFVWQTAYSQFDTIPTNKGPKSSYNTWRYSSGVTDITDNTTGHSASSAYELKGKGIDTIYSPTVRVTSTGSVVGTINLKFADYQESASVGTISAGCFVDAGTSSAATFALKTASGSTGWNTFSYTGNFLSGTHTYTAFFYNQSNNPVAVDDLNFGFTGASSVTLPVSLGAFTAYPKGSSVILGWSTLTESNNAGFYIERSNDGGNTFMEMSFEASKAINGNSNFKINYDYIDAMPNAGANYYRLRQKDLDGRVTYGKVVALDLNNVVPVKAYPIPAVGTLSLIGAEFGARLRVVSAGSGQTVLSTTVSSSGVDVSTLPPGMYLLETTVKGVPQVLDFIKK